MNLDDTLNEEDRKLIYLLEKGRDPVGEYQQIFSGLDHDDMKLIHGMAGTFEVRKSRLISAWGLIVFGSIATLVNLVETGRWIGPLSVVMLVLCMLTIYKTTERNLLLFIKLMRLFHRELEHPANPEPELVEEK